MFSSLLWRVSSIIVGYYALDFVQGRIAHQMYSARSFGDDSPESRMWRRIYRIWGAVVNIYSAVCGLYIVYYVAHASLN